MADSRDFDSCNDIKRKIDEDYNGEYIKDIKTIEQLVASYIVAEVIIDLRKGYEEINKKTIERKLPPLDIENVDPEVEELYYKVADLLKNREELLYMLKYGLEDMYRYNFKEDPSVTSTGQDSAHLQKKFGSSFIELKQINLFDHTIHVLEEALRLAQKTNRPKSQVYGILGALFHDFGKSSELREKLVGTASQRGYKAHQEVSEIYVQNVLAEKLFDMFDDVDNAIIDRLGQIVKYHHPTNMAQREDLDIALVYNADIEARKKERFYLRKKKKESN